MNEMDTLFSELRDYFLSLEADSQVYTMQIND